MVITVSSIWKLSLSSPSKSSPIRSLSRNIDLLWTWNWLLGRVGIHLADDLPACRAAAWRAGHTDDDHGKGGHMVIENEI